MSWRSDNNHVCAFLFWGFQRWWRMVLHKPWAAVGEQKVQCSHQVGKNDIILGYAYRASVSFDFWLLKEEGRSFIGCILGHSQLLIFFKYVCVCDLVCKGIYTSACEFVCMYMWRTQSDVGDFYKHSPSWTLRQSLSTAQEKFASLTLCLDCLLQGTTGSIIRALEI